MKPEAPETEEPGAYGDPQPGSPGCEPGRPASCSGLHGEHDSRRGRRTEEFALSIRPSRPTQADIYRDHVKRLVANAPKLRPEQLATLRAVFGGAR